MNECLLCLIPLRSCRRQSLVDYLLRMPRKRSIVFEVKIGTFIQLVNKSIRIILHLIVLYPLLHSTDIQSCLCRDGKNFRILDPLV